MSKSQKIIIVGAGETADIAYLYLSSDNRYDVCGFAVNSAYKHTEQYQDLPLHALEKLKENFPTGDYKLFVAMSSGQLNRNREQVFNEVKDMGYQCISYISPRAFVAETASIGENCFIFEDNVIQHGAVIGDDVVLWSGNHIGHQTKVRDHVFISSHCVVSGFCNIGENSFLGVNCTLADHITLGRDCFVGMGAIVGKNLPENTLIKPARSQIAPINAQQICGIED